MIGRSSLTKAIRGSVSYFILYIMGKYKDLNSNFYLQHYPDVKLAGIHPAEHYLRFGIQEKRIGKPISLDFLIELKNIATDKETILIVGHEASLTGAPILTLNLIKKMSIRYNIITILLNDGYIFKNFKEESSVVIGPLILKESDLPFKLAIEEVTKKTVIKYALINSVESRFVLPVLARKYIPTVILLHEFFAYTKPSQAFREALFWAGESVFSTKLTQESVIEAYKDLNEHSYPIIPQGKCLTPIIQDENIKKRNNLKYKNLFREKKTENNFIVLGVGTVQLRKGVDLFIECAAKTIQLSKLNFHFIWIGKGYDPEYDTNYSVYLEDQIKRHNLIGKISIIPETSPLDDLYKLSDALLVTSRLDPLPNVAIDALQLGLPVLCFDKATGIADFMKEVSLSETCVAKYLDTLDLSKKLVTLLDSESLYQQVSKKCMDSSKKYFNMDQYIYKLELIAEKAEKKFKQEQKDVETILNHGNLNPNFYSPHGTKLIHNVVRTYVRAWASGIGKRKPLPGFHPGIYLEEHGLSDMDADPYADYLRSGSPKGPWAYKVITPIDCYSRENSTTIHVKAALHIHVHYPELLPNIIDRVNQNDTKPDLYISVNSEEAYKLVDEFLSKYKGHVNTIKIIPNKGRDIAPLLTTFREDIQKYEIIGHIHTKKTANIKDNKIGEMWLLFLQENLLGDKSKKMIDIILSEFKKEPALGLVFPEDPNVIGWSANKSYAELLKKSLKLSNLPSNFNFPIGTMFWARVNALSPLWDLKLEWSDYPEEPLPYDGSILHALERIFPLVVSSTNHYSAVTHIEGVTR